MPAKARTVLPSAQALPEPPKPTPPATGDKAAEPETPAPEQPKTEAPTAPVPVAEPEPPAAPEPAKDEDPREVTFSIGQIGTLKFRDGKLYRFNKPIIKVTDPDDIRELSFIAHAKKHKLRIISSK